MEFLVSQRAMYPDLEEQYMSLITSHQSRLWHQVTELLLSLFSTPGASRGDNFIQLYEQFLSTFETRLNQLKFVQMLDAIAAQYIQSRPVDVVEVTQALAFLSSFVDKRKRLGEEAFAVLCALTAEFQLKRAAAQTDIDARNADVDAAAASLDTSLLTSQALAEADPAVYSAYFRAATELYKYLAYTPAESLPLESRQVLAVDIAVAALVGDGVFNFGEIIEHPILLALEATPDAWLKDLLAVFHTGDVEAFSAVVARNLASYQAQPALVAFDAKIKEKVALVCVMELASQRSSSDRSLGFGEIASAARLPVEQVEWLLMRAMSLGLLRGTIDEVAAVVHVSFIKPRVLSPSQIAGLKEKVALWSEKVKSSMFFVEDKTRELFA